MAPFVGWVVLAIWLSGFARGLHERLTQRFKGRVQLAALTTCVLLTLVLVPIGFVLTLLVLDAIALIADLAQSARAHSLLVSLVSPDNANSNASIGELIMSQGDRALALAKMVLSSAAQIVIGLVILFAGIYSVLVDGRRWYAWADENAPIVLLEADVRVEQSLPNRVRCHTGDVAFSLLRDVPAWRCRREYVR